MNLTISSHLDNGAVNTYFLEQLESNFLSQRLHFNTTRASPQKHTLSGGIAEIAIPAIAAGAALIEALLSVWEAYQKTKKTSQKQPTDGEDLEITVRVNQDYPLSIESREDVEKIANEVSIRSDLSSTDIQIKIQRRIQTND